jgi:hypothetical protein
MSENHLETCLYHLVGITEPVFKRLSATYDTPVYIFLRIQTVGGFRSIFEKYNELFHCNDVFFHAGCETDKRQNNNLI